MPEKEVWDLDKNKREIKLLPPEERERILRKYPHLSTPETDEEVMSDCRCGLRKGIRVPKPDDYVVPCEGADNYVKGSAIKQTLYHGSAVIDKIVTEGFKVDVPRAHDPGDFGWGIYLSDSLGRAFSAGGIDARPGQERVYPLLL